MISWLPSLPSSRPPRVLLFGAHCDDIEIGCGGALQVLAETYPSMEVRWTVLSSTPERAAETQAACRRLLPAAAVELDIQSFRNGYFPYVGAEIKDHFERVKCAFEPDLIFTHVEWDRHQDHRLVSELTKNTYRDHLILEYEIAKYDGDLGAPNVFIPLSDLQVRRKVDALLETFASQRSKRWFTKETFEGLMRLRGVESNAPSGYAEAFHCRKLRIVA